MSDLEATAAVARLRAAALDQAAGRGASPAELTLGRAAEVSPTRASRTQHERGHQLIRSRR